MFKNPNPYDEDVTAATNETLTKENWELISDLCEKVEQGGEQGARDCVAAIQKRLLHRIPNVQNYALTLSNSLVQTCGINVHKEISSRAFTQTLTRILQDKSTHDTVKNRILIFIQDWSNQFQRDVSLGLMDETMKNLRSQGFQFPSPEKPKKDISEYELEKQKKEEEEQLQLAMALSLSTERNGSRNTNMTPATTTNTRITSSMTTTPSQPVSHDLPHTPSVSKVKALYDFVPTESGELGFSRGDVITVLDSVYKDWWRGELHGKTGIFPVNYVEPLPEPTAADIAKEVEMEATVFAEGRNIDHLLEMLAGLDLTRDSVTENETIQNLYNKTLPVRPKIMKLIEKYSQKKDDLIALNKKYIQAIKTYDRLMNESLKKYDAYINPPHQFQPGYSVPPVQNNYQPDPSAGYFNPQQHFPLFSQAEQSPAQQPPYQAPPHQAPPHQAPPHQAPPHQVPPHQVPPHQAPPHQAPPQIQQDYQQAQYNQPQQDSQPLYQTQQDFMGQLSAYQQANQQVNQPYPPTQSQQDSEIQQQPSNYPTQLYPHQEPITPYQQQPQQPQQPASQTPFAALDNNIGNRTNTVNFVQQQQQQQQQPPPSTTTNLFLQPSNIQPPNSNGSYFNDANNIVASYPPTTDQPPQMQAPQPPPAQQISLAQISQHLQEYSSSTQQQQQYQPQNSYFNSTEELQVPQGASAPYNAPVAQPAQF